MDATYPVAPPAQSYDIFNLTDDALRDKLEFVEEIGYGNWGSVWACRPRSSTKPSSSDGFDRLHKNKLAVKLVHRRPDDVEKSKTTAARVKSLWNEMKIVGSFKSDPHPSIISFYSFIVTPSYALITMAFHPTLVPVEVDESQARIWFRFLLSGVEFLHRKSVVHNDIKPANIILSHKNIPVLIDFGFAERYDNKSSTAFHSNLSYGTPEYLSPERARGIPHDTRKSDVWSLGVTFFEILAGRTPFEESDKDEFSTKEDLERYWSRTLRGKWLGSWKMSKGVEKMIRRMLSPNADLRCTAAEAMKDSYWQQTKDAEASSHRRSSSYASSIVFEKDMAKLMDMSPWKRATKGKENLDESPGLGLGRLPKDQDLYGARHTITRIKSQPKVNLSKVQPQRTKRVPVPSVSDLPPIMASPPTSPSVSTRNMISLNATNEALTRKPLGQVNGKRDSMSSRVLGVKPSKEAMERRRSGILADLSGVSMNGVKKDKTKGKENHVNQRVREWEREKERLREMSRLEDIERERDEMLEEEKEQQEREKEKERRNNLDRRIRNDREADKENKENAQPAVSRNPSVAPPGLVRGSSPFTQDYSPRNGSGSLGAFKHGVKLSIDKTLGLYKSSTQAVPRNSLSVDIQDDTVSRRTHSERESWEDDALVREAKSSLPVVRHAIHNDHMAADNQINRMAIWMRNVEKVVEDAKHTFAASSSQPTPLPPLPLPPASLTPLSRSGSQSRRSSRLPRKVLPANKIFSDDSELSPDQTMSSYVTSMYTTPDRTIESLDAEKRQPVIPEIRTPSKQRRATVSVGSPGPATGQTFDDIDTGSPSKRKEKSRSHGNLFQLHITPVSMLEYNLNNLEKQSTPAPSPRLSAVIDRSVFIAPPIGTRESTDETDAFSTPVRISKSFDELTASPLHVEPYPPRQPSTLEVPVPDTPGRRRVEGVYDRFLMATSGVKRVGKGYQSDNNGPMHNTISHPNVSNYKQNNHRAFYTARRAMPPPVSSDDQRRTVSVDELGLMTYTPGTGDPVLKDESNTTVTLMRRAIKAMVPGKTVSKRLSRLA